ncbi:uncharacterized protein C11orf95 homolog [Megalops cyprinoides]|uniref:uncharacterized protein C11orf95 homolog n=1 Tax=Megalops cyprinoides TaxID=118141 RepID=UPI0018655D3B|nr:uncharacterized protein C11orf95 homolog [Megalops cyprinoides]
MPVYYTVMEDKEQRISESQIPPCAEQTHSLSVVLSVEEEATEMRSDWALSAAEEGGVANGCSPEQREEGVASTSYWSVSEGPDTPLLLSPVPGPARGKAGKRASRAGSSRIPGRDHRRYYHEYWRGEFLMDFDAERHRMLCMVCGSSLATLKLSTIKRHIQQKHPQSLLWSSAEKEAIRAGWDSHLRLQGAPSPDRTPAAAGQGQEGVPDSAYLSTGENACSVIPASSPTSPEVWEPPGPPSSPGPPVQTLERYLNDSFHAWFRQEVLMEYRGEEGRLICMVCGRQLPSLHLDHIKSHVLQLHPVSLLYSAEERHHILHTWAQRQESTAQGKDTSIKSEAEPHEGEASSVAGTLRGSGRGPGEGGGAQRPTRGRIPRARFPRRWQLDYLVARCPGRRGAVCMVCSQPLPVATVSAFRRHVRQQHPDSASLSRAERRALADAWGAGPSGAGAGTAEAGSGTAEVGPGAAEAGPGMMEAGLGVTEAGSGTTSQQQEGGVKVEQVDGSPASEAAPRVGEAAVGRLGRHLRRDQRRNYQARWRTDFLMDYDPRRRGLVCMVCGATLATLKVSTIKRHIQQVHPDSLAFNAEQRDEALSRYTHRALSDPPSALSGHSGPGQRTR